MGAEVQICKTEGDESEADKQAKWKEIKPCMMSDKETLPNGKLARKRPCWRSNVFNDFMDVLDAHADASLKTARKECVFLTVEVCNSLILSNN